MTNFEIFCDADPECRNMFPPQCGVGGIGGKPRLSSRSWQKLECWRRWPEFAELNGTKTDRAGGFGACLRLGEAPAPHAPYGQAHRTVEPTRQARADKFGSPAHGRAAVQRLEERPGPLRDHAWQRVDHRGRVAG